MGYNAKSKKALKEEHMYTEFQPIETSMFGPEYKGDGTYVVVGPDPYTNRKWFAEVKVEKGMIVKVK